MIKNRILQWVLITFLLGGAFLPPAAALAPLETQTTLALAPDRETAPVLKKEVSLAKPLEDVRQRASNLGMKIIFSVLLMASALVFLRAGLFLLNTISERAARYRFLKKAGPAFQVFVWAGAIYVVVAWIFHPQKETLFAFLTASGVAVGFASQDILKNIFGGLMIVVDRPFQVGDKIRVGNHYGEVIHIGLRTTRITTPDDNTVSIPNAEIVSESVSNANSGALDCQVVTEIFLPPGADLTEAKAIAWEAAVTSPLVYLKKPASVVVVEVPYDHGVLTKLKVKAYVLDTRLEFAFASDVAEATKTEFQKRGWIIEPGPPHRLSGRELPQPLA